MTYQDIYVFKTQRCIFIPKKSKKGLFLFSTQQKITLQFIRDTIVQTKWNLNTTMTILQNLSKIYKSKKP